MADCPATTLESNNATSEVDYRADGIPIIGIQHEQDVCAQWSMPLLSTLRRKISLLPPPSRLYRTFHATSRNNMLHHLMCGTWTPPGAIFTLQFDDEALTLKLIKKTAIPHDEPISWMTFDVRFWLLH